MIDSLVRLAKRGILLRLYPREGRQHLCDIRLLLEVASRIIDAGGLPPVSTFVIADPVPATNRELEAMIRRNLQKRTTILPFPLSLPSILLRHSFHARNPHFDLMTWGEVLGVMDLDTVYETSDTFQRLAIDPSKYSPDKTLEPLIRQALEQ
jgi:hypothetical protein